MAGRATHRRRFLLLAALVGAAIGLTFDLFDVFVDVSVLGGSLVSTLALPAEVWMRSAMFVASVLGALAYGRLLLANEDVARASQRYRALAENARDDIFVIDPDLTVAYMNTYAAREFGQSSPDALVGRRVRDLFPTSDVDTIERRLHEAFDGHESYSEMEFKFDGQVKWLSTRLVPLPGAGGRTESVLGISRDITGTKQAIALGEGLTRINEIVHSRLSVDEILQSVIAEATSAVGADSGIALTCDEGAWTVRAIVGYSQDMVGARFGPTELTSAERASASRQCVAIDDAFADPGLNLEVVERFGIRSLLVVPLIVRSGSVGALMFVHREAPVCFAPEVIEFANRVGSAISLAIDNARLYEEKRTVADALQSALLMLPERLPGVEFAHAYHSATEAAKVGGDFYDLFELEGDRVGVTIGDISGHGIDAAVLTSLVKNCIRVEAAEENKAPSGVVKSANHLLLEDSPPEIFATVFFGVLDCGEGTFEYCNAGHTTGCIHGPDGEVRRLPANSPLAGALPLEGFTQSEEHLGPDDVLFLYTDGLTEARRDGDFFGEERLVDMLSREKPTSPCQVVDDVMAEVMSFTGDRLRDDLAIVSMKRADG